MKKTEVTKTNTSFTVDAEHSGTIEIPSITRLLNRKPMRLPKDAEDKTRTNLFRREESSNDSAAASSPPPAPPEQAPKSTSTAISFDTRLDVPRAFSPKALREAQTRTVSKGAPLPPPPKIEFSHLPPEPAQSQPPAPPAASAHAQPMVRRAEKRLTQLSLIQWDLAKIERSADRLAQGIAHLSKSGAHSILFLAIQPPAPGARAPTFVSTAAVSPGPRSAVWAGLRWDPTITPETWNQLVRYGFVDLEPTSGSTQAGDAKRVIRSAFGINPAEFCFVVRVGSARSCRGILVVVSHQDITPELQKILAFFTGEPRPARDAA